MLYFDEILERGDRGIKTSSWFIRFVTKKYEIQIIGAVHHDLWLFKRVEQLIQFKF